MSSLFKKTFQPKKAPARKNLTISPLNLDATERAREFGLDYGVAQLKINDQLIIHFDVNLGEWLIVNDTSSSTLANGTINALNINKEVNKLQKSNQQLLEENNLLKIKTEVLTDMVAEIYCENKLSKEQSKTKK